jgi:hypothetical protein
MTLHEKLENEMKSALRGGETVKLSVLRMVISAVKMIGIEKNIKEIGDADVLQILQKQIKQRKESMVQFEKGNRKDLVDKEAAELLILESYMPKQLTEEELLGIVKEAIAETGAAVRSDMGKVMKIIMPKVAGKADGKTVNQLLMQFLK